MSTIEAEPLAQEAAPSFARGRVTITAGIAIVLALAAGLMWFFAFRSNALYLGKPLRHWSALALDRAPEKRGEGFDGLLGLWNDGGREIVFDYTSKSYPNEIRIDAIGALDHQAKSANFSDHDIVAAWVAITNDYLDELNVRLAAVQAIEDSPPHALITSTRGIRETAETTTILEIYFPIMRSLDSFDSDLAKQIYTNRDQQLSFVHGEDYRLAREKQFQSTRFWKKLNEDKDALQKERLARQSAEAEAARKKREAEEKRALQEQQARASLERQKIANNAEISRSHSLALFYKALCQTADDARYLALSRKQAEMVEQRDKLMSRPHSVSPNKISFVLPEEIRKLYASYDALRECEAALAKNSKHAHFRDRQFAIQEEFRRCTYSLGITRADIESAGSLAEVVKLCERLNRQ